MLLRQLGRRMRRVATGTGMLALAVPLAWPSGVGGQHLDVPSAASVRSGLVQLADFVSGQSSPAPSVPVQQTGTAAGQKHLVPSSQTQGLKHATGHAPGKGQGQLPLWAAHGPSGSASGTFTARPPVRGFDPATSTLDQSGTTAQTDLYKNADGSYTRRVFQSPVNYKTSSGSWAPIDPALVQGQGGRWREKANALAVSFAASGSDKTLGTVASADGSQRVSFSLTGAGNVAASASGSSVTYPGILPGTDVTETATPDGMSESLTLASAAAGTSWTFPLTLKGLTASLDGDTVDLSNSSGAVVWVIPPAVARSGPVNLATADSQASSVLKYQLVTYQGGPALEMTLDPSWLDAPGRVFPVTIDPSLSPNPEASDYAQSLNGTAQTANNSGSEFLPSGTVTDSNGTFKDIDFLDFSQLGTVLPNQHITAASLHLFDVWAYQCTTTEEVYAYQVTGAWRPSVALTYPGPAYSTKDAQWTGTAYPAACDNLNGKPGQGGWISLAFNASGLALLNGWTLGTTANYGFAVAPSLTDEQMWKQFDSANDGAVPSGTAGGGDCSGNCEPYLQMTYTTDVAPQVDSQFPPDNYDSPTLTPELIASGTDPDQWPDASPQYEFTVYTSSGTQVVSSGLLSSGDWTVPPGKLAWGQAYYWTVQAYDGVDYSPDPQPDYFTTAVPQPLVTSQLSQNPAGPGFNPQTGNWTSSATDAQVPGAGPALAITRDYNSADPRISGAFGAGWSSVLDMKVSPGENGSSGTAATQVVTYPDGEEVGFGLNPGGTTYSPPPGRFATLAPAAGGGFTLTDKNDTVYTFTQPLGSGVYGITAITDALRRTETFTYTSGHITTITSASGRTLAVTWTTPSGAGHAHVTSVVTPDATAGNSATAQNWTYNYSADQLSSACPPASTTVCTAYSYTSGSDYPDAVLDSGPHSYWRLDETSGGTAASSVLANEGADNASYTSVTLGRDAGPLTGSPAKAAYFTGASSYVTLPRYLVTATQYQSISLWFKTTTVDGVLWSSSASGPAGTTTGSYSPEMYIGDDGKLVGAFWDGNASDVMMSAAAVDNGQWHNAVLTDTASGQWLYLDGQQIGTLSKGFASHVQTNDFVGAGFLGGGWPDEPHYNTSGNNTGYAYGFAGDISDAAIWNRQVTLAEVQAMYAAGTHQAALLTKLTRPSGSVYAQVSYDPLTSRVTSDTDSNGGTWHLNPPTAQGSSQGWVASVLGTHPGDYYRLNDTGAAQADDSAYNCACSSAATYYNVTEGVSGGPFADQPVTAFNGTSSYLDMPLSDTASGAPGSVGVWFKTTGTSQVLYSEATGPVTGPAPASYNPVLYVGQDGKLNGELWDGNTTTAVSHAAVNDGKWHYAVLAAGTSSQSLYVDGALQATISGSVRTEPWTNVAAGAGFTGGAWPDQPSSTVTARWFNGDMAELAWYPYQLSAAQVAGQWSTVQYATGLTPVQVSTVTDPGGNTLKYAYDLLNSGRELSSANAEGGITAYTYDTGGFPASVTDPDGFVTQTGHDPRGNLVSQTTCQDQADTECSTSYRTYYPDDTAKTLTTPDPRNDMMLTDADGRSASSTDPTYQTRYAYNSLGELTGVTTPPVPGYPSGRTTTYAYTDGTTSAGGYGGAVPPNGLPYQETTPGGAVTTTLYYADGDVAQVTDPDGQRTVYTYDGLGRKASQTEYSDSYPGGLVTSYTYDANGNLSTEADPAVTNRVTGAVHTAKTTTTYDPDGDVLTRVTADLTGGDAARTDTRTYNGYDQLASDTDPAGGKTTYTYDAYGDMASQTDPDGNLTQYAYDGDGHLLTTTLANYTGSPPGSQAAAPLVQESRAYDPAGRLAMVTDAMGRITRYYYTDNGLSSGIQNFSPDWSQWFTTQWNAYDGAGNLTERWTDNMATDTTYTVDAANRTTQQVTDPSGLDRTTTVSYTPDDQQASVTSGGPDGVSQTTSYTYDPAGNMLSKSTADPGSGGPVAWYPLTQTSGTAVTDSVGGGQPAAASGVTWTGSGASFTGTSGQQVATSGPVLDTTGSFTVAAWVNLAGSTENSQTVLSQDAGTDSGFYLKYYPNSGGWQFTRPLTDTSSPATVNADSASPAVTGTWTFLAGTYDANSGTMTLYVNGSASGGTTGTDSTPIASHGPLVIGRAKWNGNESDWFGGTVADVQVYPRALAANEVSTLYGLGRGGGDVTTSALTTTWTRDQRGLPVTMTSPDGAVTGYTYDEAGQLAQTTEPTVTTETYGNAPVTARPVTWTGYDTFGEVAETKDPDGNVTTYGYDGDGRPVSKALPPYTPPGGSPVTAVDTTAYDGAGLVTSVTDGLNHTTHYGYDQLGNRVTVTAPDTSVTTTVYDADGEPLSVTSPTGAVTDSTYDYMGRRATSTQVERDTGSGTASYTANYSYNDSSGGWLSLKTSPDGVATSYTYNPAGQKITVTDGAGDKTSYAYDGLGRQAKLTYPDGTATSTGYDAAGNVTSTSNLDASGNVLATMSATFDGEGAQLSATDAAGNSSTFTYDPTGLVTAEVQPVTSSSGITTSFGYDAAGNQTLYTDGNGSPWQYTYNSWGLQESRVEPATSQYTTAADSTFTTAYNADQQPATLTEPGGVTVTDSYNNVSELAGQSATGADAATPARTFGYDTAGHLTSAATSNTAASGSNATSESFTYNDRGQVLTAAGSAGATSYSYNGDGLVTSVADTAGTTGYTYDNTGRLATLANPATGTTATYSYNPDSQVSAISYGSGNDTRSFTYDGQRRLASDTLKTSSGTVVASQAYGYDPDGHLTSETTSGLAGPASSTYTYDQAGRLASWDNGTATTAYGYDGNGNLTTNGAKTYTYDARNELMSDGTGSYTYTARGTPASEPGPAGTLTVSFDAYGDQATAGTGTYTYDALGRLTATTPAAGTGQQLSYVGNTGAIASDGTTAYTWDPAGTSLFAAGSPGGGSGKLVLANAHGDVTGQFSPADTTITASRAYDPWGTVTAGTLVGQLGYQSALTDPATGKDLMGARWYNPGAGSFTSADTIPQPPVPGAANGNPFAYTGDDPLDATDPTGHWDYIPDPFGPVKEALGTLEAPVNSALGFIGSVSGAVTGIGSKAAPVDAELEIDDWECGLPCAVADVITAIGIGAAIYYATSGGSGSTSKAKSPTTRTSPAATPGPFVVVSGVHAKLPHNTPNDGSKKTSSSSSSGSSGGGGGGGSKSGTTRAKPTPVYHPHHVQQASRPQLPPAQNEADIVQQVIQRIRELAAAGTGNGGNGGGLPAPPASDGACPPPPGTSGGSALDPLSLLLNLVGPGTGQDQQPPNGGQSFTPRTRVLLPGGKTAAISSLKPGDKVTARDTTTGKDQTETVTAVEVHHDTDLYNLRVKTPHGTQVIHTTSSHLFYDPYLHQWRPASKLKKGEHLQTPDGTIATADGGTTPKVHDGWMWDLTVPGNNDHDFYVVPITNSNGQRTYHTVAGDTPVLVHNCGDTPDGVECNCAPGTGAGPADPPIRVDGDWTRSDIWRGAHGLRPNDLGDRLELHHADQMPGSAIHELPQDVHRGPGTDLHRNPFNQGVTSDMRTQDTQLHWWYRSMEQGWGQESPDWWFDNWPPETTQ